MSDNKLHSVMAEFHDVDSLMSAAEMTTTFFTPSFVESRDLAQLARDIHGRKISIEEKGGHFAAPVENIQYVGDSLVIYEDQASAERIVAWCQEMDHSLSAGDMSG